MGQDSRFPHLILHLPAAAVNGLASLLQYGVLVPVDRPMELIPFLLQLPGFTAAYIEDKVQTLFIDGTAADRLDLELAPGTTLALSAAMPGLAGAIFRRQGVHSTLRSQSRRSSAPSSPESGGFITLKLFNTIGVDRAADLLEHGIHLSGPTLRDFALRREALFQPPATFTFNGRGIALAQLLPLLADTPVLVLTVLFSSPFLPAGLVGS